ncbi:glycosyltransferase [Clostridium butyricum]|uniref:glycosyltransferase n=1 Tax=Clostridium butyricum TaxID=1492 RepID=UPI002AB0093B|nr:glycosyltransferase [Clostridium butyricum]
MKKNLIYSIDDMHLVKRDAQLLLYIDGWVLYTEKDAILQMEFDGEIYKLSFNQKRDDVSCAYNFDNNINLGFKYEISIKVFKKIKLFLINNNKKILLKKCKFKDIGFINHDINFNFESISINNSNAKLKGWLVNKSSKDVANILIKNENNKILYNNTTNVKRTDVFEFFHENVNLNCGFEIDLHLDNNTDQLFLFSKDGGINVNLKTIKVAENWKNNKIRMFKKLLKIKLQIIKNQIISTIKNGNILSLSKYVQNYKQQYKSICDELFLPEFNFNNYTPYDKWVENNVISKIDYKYMERIIEQFDYTPKISILMPVWNVDKVWLDKAIESIKNQSYKNWELCIADDKSTKSYIKPYLESLMKNDDRIKVYFRKENGNISAATNSAFKISSGEYILLMDNDDELECNALYEVVRKLQGTNKPDIIYSDDDKIDENGKRYAPQFKPDWSPELLLSFMYFCHIFCFRREMYEKTNGCRKGFEGCQDYDLALRMTELTDNIAHIDKVLYHWRSIEGSTAQDGNAKPEAFERGIRAVQEALDRRGIKGKVIRPDFAIKSNLGIFSINFPNKGPEVSILIPTKNQKHLLKRCIDSIVEKTKYINYKIVVINNDSDEDETIKYLDELRRKHTVLDISNLNGKFSYAYINNQAVKMVDSEYVLFLNNDTEVISGNWLSDMVGYSQFDNVGIVGARLLFPDNRVQHAGVVLGLYNGMVAPAFKLLPDYDLGYYNFAKVTRNYSCVTAACMIMKRTLFNELNGFDEEKFAVAYNDVDLNIRCLNHGKRIVYAAQAELYHYEGATRGFVDNIDEVLNYKKLYGDYIDRYYNRNLSVYDEQFKISSDRTLDYGNSLHNKNILFCTHNLNFEGAPLHLFELVKGFKKIESNFNPIIISPLDGPLKEMYEGIGAKVIIIQYNIYSNGYREGYEECIEGLIKSIEDKNIDFIYANTLETFVFIDIANRLKKTSVWNIHESADYKTYFKHFDKYVYNKFLECFVNAQKVIFVCNSTLTMYNDMNVVNNFDYIYNGIDKKCIDLYKEKVSKKGAKKILEIPENYTVISIVGTVCERKGQLDFVKAALEVLDTYNEKVLFVIVGCRKGEYLDKIKQLIQERKAEQKFVLAEETKEVNIYYRASDIFVCASYNESFPRVTLEAMAFDLPIISTNVFGLKEQILENINGLLYEPGDISKLEECIKLLLNDNKEMEKLSGNSFKVLNMLNSHDAMINKYYNILNRFFK